MEFWLSQKGTLFTSKGLICDAQCHILTVLRLRGCHRSGPNSVLTFRGRLAFCNKNIQIMYIFPSETALHYLFLIVFSCHRSPKWRASEPKYAGIAFFPLQNTIVCESALPLRKSTTKIMKTAVFFCASQESTCHKQAFERLYMHLRTIQPWRATSSLPPPKASPPKAFETSFELPLADSALLVKVRAHFPLRRHQAMSESVEFVFVPPR